MNDEERIRILEETLAQVLKPVKGIPFSVVIKSLAEHQVIPIDPTDKNDASLIELLSRASVKAGRLVASNPICRPRPNEVGNDMEPFLMKGIASVGLKCARPLTKSGAGRSTGYPDLLIYDERERPTYIECKIYSRDTAATAQRSFYLSPSKDFKVTEDARHLVIGFEMVANELGDGSRNSAYRPVSYKIIDLHDLSCDVKYEFNSDNSRLYDGAKILATGDI